MTITETINLDAAEVFYLTTGILAKGFATIHQKIDEIVGEETYTHQIGVLMEKAIMPVMRKVFPSLLGVTEDNWQERLEEFRAEYGDIFSLTDTPIEIRKLAADAFTEANKVLFSHKNVVAVCIE